MTSGRPAALRQTIAGPTGALEALVEDPGTGGTLYAVVCHPHSLFGGSMDNKVVTTVCRALHDVDIATVRFNFRGVGASAGIFDRGIGETEDAEAVADWSDGHWPGRCRILAGFSFGSFVALRLAQTRRASFLITIAPPVQRFEFSSLASPGCPWLIVQGDADEVVDPGSVSQWAAGLSPSPTFVAMPGVGHFFHGRLEELRAAVRDAVRDAVPKDVIDAARGS